MNFTRVVVVALLVGASSGLLAQSNLSPEAQLKAAMNREVVTRDLTGAIDLYEHIVATFASNHPVASKALLQLGGIYERLGRPEAQARYRRIVAEYADTGATYVTARARLNAIQETSAGPFKARIFDAWLKDAGNISPSPDGQYLVYTRVKPVVPPASSRQETVVTYVRDLSSGRERVLVDARPGEAEFGVAVWSPDSKRVAVGIETGESLECRVVIVATAESHTVGKGLLGVAAFSWAPDSRSLAFALRITKQGDYEHRVVSVATRTDSVGLDTVNASPQPATWSPDGRRLAYVVSDTKADTIRVKTLGSDGAVSIEVAKESPTTRTSIGRWLPSGDIQYAQSVTGGNDYYLVNASGGSPRPICEGRGSSGGDGCQQLSPDGSLQIVRKNVSGGGRIVLRSLKDGSEHPLTPEAVLEQLSVGFSPDGRLFGFRSNRDGGFGFYVVPTDALPVASPIKIVALDSDASSVTGLWTPAGLLVRIANNQTNEYRVDLDPRTGKPLGPPIRLTEDSPINTHGRISPDGRRIAYISRGRPTGIALMDANGAHERVIKEIPPDMLNRMTLVGWLSDADLLIADARLGTGAMRTAPKHLMRLNTATGEMREAGPDVDSSFIEAMSGGAVVYNGPNDTFMTRPIVGGAVRTFIAKNWWDYVVGGPWLAYTTGDDSGGKDKPMPGDIRVQSLETGAERVVVKFPDTQEGNHLPMDVSIDGKYLLYQDPWAKMMMANVDTGESWPVLKNPPAGVNFEYADARLSPDGTYLIVEGDITRTSWRAFDGVTYDAIKKLIAAKK